MRSFPASSIILLLICPLFASRADAQTIAPRPGINEVLERAAEQTKVYVEAFKNLLADETKTFEMYDKNGAVKKTKTVRSSFIVYQFTKDQNQLNEYRNVTSVDGKPVSNADKRAQDFFEQIQRVQDSQAELQRLRDESLRYDQDLAISGLTLFQSLALDPKLRPYFEFRIERSDTINGRPVYVVSYRQIKESPYIRVNDNSALATGVTQNYDVDTDRDLPMNPRLRGTLWIDSETYQVGREHRELTVQPEGFTEPAVSIANDFEYQASDFGILTPRTITHTQYRVRVKDRQTVKEIKVTFEYSKFTKPDVEVKSGEVKQP